MASSADIPQMLFKYRSLVGENREYVRKTLVDNEIWFSSPAAFNDPFDCKAHMSFSGSRETWKKHLMRSLREHQPHLSRKQRQEGVSRALKKGQKPERSALLKNLLDGFQSDIDQLGVYCLSARNDDLLMWSYYADGHAGLCLGFLHRPGVLGPAFPVTYSSRFPEVNYFDTDQRTKAEALFLTKAATWSHEEEWRVIDYYKPPGVRRFPPALLALVIFGVSMPEVDRSDVLSWLETRSEKPEVYEACLKEGEFRLDIRRLEKDD